MKDLMLVGGLPYSGKTQLCTKLAEIQPDKYRYLGLDDYYKRAEEDSTHFFRYLTITSPQMANAMGVSAAIAAGVNLDSAMQTMKTSLVATRQKEMWEQLLKLSSMTCITDDILQTPDGITPVVESLFFNRGNRAEFYEAIKDYIEILNQAFPGRPDVVPEELDRVRKTIVYFDLGLETCMARYNADEEKEKKPMINEPVMRHIHRTQELPTTNEFPNLEVVLIRNDAELDAFVQEST